jgi:hypothetical protein
VPGEVRSRRVTANGSHPVSGESRSTVSAVAGAIFALSLSLRALDRDVCAYVPVGTHCLWHLLNGLVLYLVSRTMIRMSP